MSGTWRAREVKVPSLGEHYQGMTETRMSAAADIERLYREQGQRLWWALLAYAGDREIASDASAEAFTRALSSSESIRDPAAWVWRVAFRVAAAELKSGRQTLERERTYEIDEKASQVLEVLRTLSRNQRAVIVLYYYADRPTKEIASTLGMSVATVSVHLHRARQRLKLALGEDDD
jgi:RNA polymerase sigma-70 factor (ECF subfamily)